MPKKKETTASAISQEVIMSKIYVVRGQKVMMDNDIAKLYGVETKSLNQAIRRNIERFPYEFMFTLTKEEYESLRSQIVTLEKGRGKYSKYLPNVLTELGIVMLSSVLKSKKAIQINLQIVRTFVRLRQIITENKSLAQRIGKIEQKLSTHEKAIIKIIEQMSVEEVRPKRKIGFKIEAK
ncbi:MAG: ORF6N domain-containing protein [Elusimicrobiota bacterium]